MTTTEVEQVAKRIQSALRGLNTAQCKYGFSTCSLTLAWALASLKPTDRAIILRRLEEG